MKASTKAKTAPAKSASAKKSSAAAAAPAGKGHNRAIPPLDKAQRLRLYEMMVRIREFEDQVHRSYLDGLVHGTTHLCQGQEGVAAGANLALAEGDYVSYTYRGHGHCLARGMEMEWAYAELFGRETGMCTGLGGSMHFTDIDRGLIGAAGIVGGGLPAAVGAGLSAQLDGKGRVSTVFFGDGTVNIGAFHESMNIAQVWKLPVIFICENNLYGEFTRINFTTPFEDLTERAKGYAMRAVQVDGNDVEAVYRATAEAAERARAGEGPTFIECKTYRHRGHSRTDPAKYRDAAEVEAWLARDPIPAHRARLVKDGVITEKDADRITEDARREVKAAADRAATAPWPDANQNFAAKMFA
ncbi:MAG TPA: thiamine pyrophosphate-dependent dehydrogenase E1 component subunit alpha [Dongiaceae bacterium]